MATAIQKQFNDLKINIFDFDDIGDTLPMHNHAEDSIHITIVARGSFRMHGDGWEMTAKAGDIVNWQVGKRHEFVALEPNSRCVNIPKNQSASS
jgi:quercetin dioxygenase-like cupin family protein